ncbi:MAG TPA: MAPEG family protein [Sphingomicrobium sp.]|nr:MAPEG family protein [Sphingomicrobium sp.]
MPYSPILAPVVALVAWTIIVMFWMVVTRFAEFRRLGVTLSNIPPGARGVDLEGRADPRAQWKSHNYTHLLEQPVLFYAICLTLALMGFGGGINYWLAWGYVGLRVVHSLIQCTVNVVRFRLAIFSLASLCLLGLTVHAGARILHDCGILSF